MKKRNKTLMIMTAVLLIGAAASPLWARNTVRPAARGTRSTVDYGTGFESVIAELEPGVLTAGEEEGILLMREEEKLARDVYLTLGEQWNIPVFTNIARSEETHMDAVGLLIERYGLTDPVMSAGEGEAAPRGVYSNDDFNDLYRDLTDQGSQSIEDAFRVGALIEDLDIADLQRLIRESGNEDVKIVYQNLLKGSRNHLRSFSRQLSRSGETYAPEYISLSDFDQIISGGNEAGFINDPDFIY